LIWDVSVFFFQNVILEKGNVSGNPSLSVICNGLLAFGVFYHIATAIIK
jgi:hypothetical protein